MHEPTRARPVPAPARRIARTDHVPLVAWMFDAVMLSLACGFAVLGRTHFNPFPPGATAEDFMPAGPLIAVLWVVCILLFDGYQHDIFGAGTDEYRRVLHASSFAAGLVGVICFVLKYELSRGFFVFYFAAGIPALVLGRFVLRRFIHRARRQGLLTRRVVIAGSCRQIDELAHALGIHPWMGYDVVGALTPPTEYDARTPSGIRVWGNSDDVHWVVNAVEADAVLIAGGAYTSSRQLRQAVWDLEHSRGVQVIIAPSLTDIARERVRIRPVGGLPLVHVDPPRHEGATKGAKRTFDVLGALALLIVFSPLFLVAAWQIRRFDGGPIMFRQTRMGRDRRAFECLKFRTMVQDAEDLLLQLHIEAGHEDGLFKMKDDPRITRPGRWLRRYSVDELPQLVNVLKGDMSLVGPRPPLMSEFQRYDDAARRRLHVRPGMTGLWQVSGRSNLTYTEAIRLDLYYVDNWSMLQDLTILLRTFTAVFASRGAY